MIKNALRGCGNVLFKKFIFSFLSFEHPLKVSLIIVKSTFKSCKRIFKIDWKQSFQNLKHHLKVKKILLKLRALFSGWENHFEVGSVNFMVSNAIFF